MNSDGRSPSYSTSESTAEIDSVQNMDLMKENLEKLRQQMKDKDTVDEVIERCLLCFFVW